jgi:hypothetical protein
LKSVAGSSPELILDFDESAEFSSEAFLDCLVQIGSVPGALRLDGVVQVEYSSGGTETYQIPIAGLVRKLTPD